MYSLANNPILTSYQIEILKQFFGSRLGKQFFLTGGTALSAFYLAHRESKDLDFFSLERFDLAEMSGLIQEIATSTNSLVETKISTNSYSEVYLRNSSVGWVQRIDVVKEIPRQFGEIVDVDGVRVDSLENIGSNKILTIIGRLEVKDYLDLYFILTKTDKKFADLFALAKQKDLGLSEFIFANIIVAAADFEIFPEIKLPFDRQDFVKFYENLSKELLLQIKPEEKTF